MQYMLFIYSILPTIYIYFHFKPNCTNQLDGLWLGATDISTTDERTFIWEKSGKVRLG